MAFSNQWMNPAYYKNMNNEQVDWANLAQQWIKMKETTPALPPGQQGRSTMCESNLLGSSQTVDIQNTSNVLGSNNTFDEHNIVGSLTGNNVEKPSAWNSWTWQQQQQWNWNWASGSTGQPTKTPIIEPVNPIRQPYVAPPVLAEPSPSFPIVSPNKQFTTNNFWAGPRVPHPIESDQWNKNMLSNIDDRNQDPSYIDAAKRKQLPAWLREGLEKMEREKRRKMEREQSSDENENSNFHTENNFHELHHSPHNFDNESQIVDEETEHDSPDGYNDDTESTKTEYIKNDPSPLIPRKTKAQIWEDTMLSLRQILTKLLMDVTNDMMLSIVKEVLKTAVQTDIQGNQSQTSLAGKLGLGVYGTESETDESDDEQHSTSLKQSSKLDSDAAIQERILKRQREFSNIEARILMELDQLEDREKLVRSKFDSSVKLSGDINDNGSQVVENIQPKGRNVDEGGTSQKIEKAPDKNKKILSNYSSIKNGQKKKKSKSKRSSSSSESSSSSSSSSESSSSSSESKKSDDTDSKYSYRKNDKIKSKYSNKKHKADSFKRKRRSRSKNRSRSHSRSKRSRSRSKVRSSSRSRHNRRSPHSYKSRRSRSPISRHGSSRKYKSKRNSSSSSNESRSTKRRHRR